MLWVIIVIGTKWFLCIDEVLDLTYKQFLEKNVIKPDGVELLL
jgi:hypothetical protein